MAQRPGGTLRHRNSLFRVGFGGWSEARLVGDAFAVRVADPAGASTLSRGLTFHTNEASRPGPPFPPSDLPNNFL